MGTEDVHFEHRHLAQGVRPLRLSVVIPALDEAEIMPALLDRLAEQTRTPDEVIVADAGSADRTPKIAQERGCAVVAGGPPGAGRNAGAAAASGDLLLFLDADVAPPVDFIERALTEFLSAGYGVAGCLLAAPDCVPSHRRAMAIGNFVILATRSWFPHAPGCCIFAKREVHEAMGGFDPRPLAAEDHDYARRALKRGEFGILRSVRMPVSTRRMETVGVIRLGVQYGWSEIGQLLGKRPPLQPSMSETSSRAASLRRRMRRVSGERAD